MLCFVQNSTYLLIKLSCFLECVCACESDKGPQSWLSLVSPQKMYKLLFPSFDNKNFSFWKISLTSCTSSSGERKPRVEVHTFCLVGCGWVVILFFQRHFVLKGYSNLLSKFEVPSLNRGCRRDFPCGCDWQISLSRNNLLLGLINPFWPFTDQPKINRSFRHEIFILNKPEIKETNVFKFFFMNE